MLARGMEARGVDGRADRAQRRLFQGQGRLDAHVQPRKELLWRPRYRRLQVPIGTGLAFAHKYNGSDNVSLTYFGDGSAIRARFTKPLNMAALWKLPVVYIIENKPLRHGTSVERASATTELYRHGEAFGIPGERVDGMDVLAVRAARRAGRGAGA